MSRSHARTGKSPTQQFSTVIKENTVKSKMVSTKADGSKDGFERKMCSLVGLARVGRWGICASSHGSEVAAVALDFAFAKRILSCVRAESDRITLLATCGMTDTMLLSPLDRVFDIQGPLQLVDNFLRLPQHLRLLGLSVGCCCLDGP